MTSREAAEMTALADRLAQVAKVMRAARHEHRNMSVWPDDLKAVEDAESALRRTAARPDAGYAVWVELASDTSWIDGRDVVLLVRGMEVTARYCPGEWSEATPDHPREYSGAVWSCFDDAFQLEIEECSKDPSEWSHDGATHWRLPVALLEQPATPRPEPTIYDAMMVAGRLRGLGVKKWREYGQLEHQDVLEALRIVWPATPGYAAGFEACREAIAKLTREHRDWACSEKRDRECDEYFIAVGHESAAQDMMNKISAHPAPAPAAEEVTVEELAQVIFDAQPALTNQISRAVLSRYYVISKEGK